MTRPRRPFAGAALVLGAATLWATFGLFAKTLYARGYTPIELASIRAWVAFLGIALVTATRPRRLYISRRDFGLFLLYGVVGFAIFEYLYFLAMERTTVAIAVALLYTAPAFVVVLSRILWQEPIDAAKLVSLALVLCGVVLVTGALRALTTGSAKITGAAALIGLASGLAYGLYTIFSKLALSRYSAATALFWSFGFAALFLLPIAPPLEPLLRSRASIPLLLALGIVPTLLAYFLYLAGLRWLPASTASMLASIEPVVATLLAAALLSERVGIDQAAGMAMIVAAAVILARRVQAVGVD